MYWAVGAEMLFAAVFAVAFLHRRLNRFHLLGILCCVVRSPGRCHLLSFRQVMCSPIMEGPCAARLWRLACWIGHRICAQASNGAWMGACSLGEAWHWGAL